MTQALADELAYFAETASCPHVTPIITHLRRPMQVAVLGRDGVGRGTVAAALRQRGVAVPSNGANAEAAEVRVLVVAEAVKPEDLELLHSDRQPALIVLTKAGLAGSDPAGPLAIARRRAAAIQLATGAPTVPVVGLLAAIGVCGVLDEELVTALRSFVTEPADLTSVDAFLDGVHSVGREVRSRLIERLDRFSIAHAVLALADGSGTGDLAGYLRRLGNLDEVISALALTAAPARHSRVCAAVAELHCLAIRLDDDRLAALAASDASVMAAMTAAVEVIEAAGLAVDRRDTRSAHTARAVHWRRYGRGPVDALHRRCSADIVKGSLRLLAEQST